MVLRTFLWYFPEYHEKGEGSTIKINTASNYMSRLGNKAFSFVSPDARSFNSRQEAMDDIEERKSNEAVEFWRSIVEKPMKIIDEIHPLTRMSMCHSVLLSKTRCSVKSL